MVISVFRETGEQYLIGRESVVKMVVAGSLIVKMLCKFCWKTCFLLKIFSKKPHPFLHGIHTPLDRECLYENLTVDGNIPLELDGLYVRNGPNPVKPPNERRYHWF